MRLQSTSENVFVPLTVRRAFALGVMKVKRETRRLGEASGLTWTQLEIAIQRWMLLMLTFERARIRFRLVWRFVALWKLVMQPCKT